MAQQEVAALDRIGVGPVELVGFLGEGLDRVTVVDWKSGTAPRDPEERAAREVQLAVYRLAWAEWTGVPLEQVDAAFHYVGDGATVRPARLLIRPEIEELLAARVAR